MTPYELRFEIFKHATNIAESEFQSKHSVAEYQHANNYRNPADYPQYPTYEQIESIAERINTFVSVNS